MSGLPVHPVPPQPPSTGHPVPPGSQPPTFRKHKHKLFPVHQGIPATVDPRSIAAGHSVAGMEDLRSGTVTTCRLELAATQTIADTTLTALTPDTSLADPENMWDGTHAYVVIPWSATWEVSFNIRYDANGTGYRQASVYRSVDDGSTFTNVTKAQVNLTAVTAALGPTLNITYLSAYDRGDFLRVETKHNKGGAIDVVQFDFQVAYRGGQ